MLFDSGCPGCRFCGVGLVATGARLVTIFFLNVGAFIFLFMKGFVKRGDLRTWIKVALSMKLLKFPINYRVSRTIRMFKVFILNISCNYWGGLHSSALLLYGIWVLHEGIRRFTLWPLIFRMLNLLKHFNQVSLHLLIFIVSALRILQFLVGWWSRWVILTADWFSSSNYGIGFSIFVIEIAFKVLGVLTTHRFLMMQRRRDRGILMVIMCGSHGSCLPQLTQQV